MIQLVSKDLSDETKEKLKELQDEVNNQSNFEKKTEKAKSLWNSKSSSVAGKSCFDEVKKTLGEMCVSIEVCNYCEGNEANDIEHIHPKSFFPEFAFIWDNYLLACKQCNSGYKLDKCYTINDANELKSLSRGSEPENGSTVAFINPRLENPNDFMILDTGMNGIATWRFNLLPGLTDIEKYKAEKTLEILQLNERDTLIHARNSAAIYYYERLDRLVQIINAASIDELKKALTPYDIYIDFSIGLNEIKNNLKESFKKDILEHQHPSVWYSIKTIQSQISDKWKGIFEKIPEARNW